VRLLQPPARATSLKQATLATAHEAARRHSFVIGNDDVLAINVWKEPDISRSIPVRSDGKISLPLVGEVQADGTDSAEAGTGDCSQAEELHLRARSHGDRSADQQSEVQHPGTGNKPGSYVITNSATVLDAIAVAGGFRDFAKQKSIYILRQNADGTQTRIPFNYKEVVKGQNPGQNIKLAAAGHDRRTLV
jgi:polysaccharide biosynthesis/export protein